jgi:DNA-binding response OmpR family regulator/two-component sensor histidine kinase
MEGGLAGPITAKATKLLGIARNECERLVRLINDILDLRKIEAGMLELRENNVEAQHLIKRTVNGIRGMAQASNIDLVTELNTGGPVYCDEDRTIQVLTNLVSNAIKFSPKNGRVTIALIPGEGNTFRFVVKDKGAGIPENQMNKLFGKFQQIDQSDGRPKEGTGLGLAISKKIVEQHKGRIGVKSKPGEGTEFWFELPATFAPVPLIKDDHLGQHPSYPALIVEDDDPFAEILRCEMVQHGFEVIRASTLAEAQAVLSKTKPVVIMLDLTLPDGDGMDLIRQLNESIDDREILFVIVTGSLAQTEKNCNYPALVDWLNKPFDDERLQQALSAVRKRMKQATVLLVERDPAMREILKNHLELINVAYVEAEPGDIISNFRQHKPDLVIMDMVNPESGMHVLEQLKQESNGRVPVIVYSSQELNSEQEAHFKGSRVAFLMKSVSSEETLLQTVRNFLSGLLLKLPSD